MINKYAEIKDKLALYNACKGVLRVKTAFTLPELAIGATSAAGGYYGSKLLSKGLGLEGGKENDFLHKRLGIDPNSKYRKFGDRALKTLGVSTGLLAGMAAPNVIYLMSNAYKNPKNK